MFPELIFEILPGLEAHERGGNLGFHIEIGHALIVIFLYLGMQRLEIVAIIRGHGAAVSGPVSRHEVLRAGGERYLQLSIPNSQPDFESTNV